MPVWYEEGATTAILLVGVGLAGLGLAFIVGTIISRTRRRERSTEISGPAAG